MDHASPHSITTPIRTPDGVGLFHRDWGGGRPVVFVASWSLPSDSWAYQMLALSEAGCRCIAYDRRGHGRSDDPGRGFDLDTLADDLAAVLESLDVQDATLVGFSMGTAEIVRYLSRHGASRVARIVLIGTTTPMLSRAVDNPLGVDPALFEAFRRDSLMRCRAGAVPAPGAGGGTPGRVAAHRPCTAGRPRVPAVSGRRSASSSATSRSTSS